MGNAVFVYKIEAIPEISINAVLIKTFSNHLICVTCVMLNAAYIGSQNILTD